MKIRESLSEKAGNSTIETINGHPFPHRMDRDDMEPSDGVFQNHCRVQELLRRENGETAKGYGIPARVRDFGAVKVDKPDSECISWAVQKGNSTEPISETSGLGLHVLREFLLMNGGLLQIVSGNGYFHQSGGDPETYHTETMRNSIDGTLVNIRVIYDDKLYMMAGEDL